MTWAGAYPWLLVFHVLCVFAFLAIHGVSMGVWWRVRRERDRAKPSALLGLSVARIDVAPARFRTQPPRGTIERWTT